MAFQSQNNTATFLIMKTPLTTKPKIVLVEWNKQQPLVVMPEGDILPMVITPTIVDTADPLPSHEGAVEHAAIPADTATVAAAEQPKSKEQNNGNSIMPEITAKKLAARSCKKANTVIETTMEKTASHESQRRPRKSFRQFLNDDQQNIYSRLDKDRYRCNLCDIVKTRQYMIAHVRDCHSELRLHKCDVCQKSFKRAHTLSTHLLTHQTELRSTYMCDMCDFKTLNRASFKWHYYRLHTDHHQFCCEHCHKEFKSKRELSAHIMSHGEANDMCEICGKLYRGKYLLRAHLRTHQYTDEFTCQTCKKKLSCEKALNKHMKLHNREFKCYDCGAKYPTKVRLIKHRNTHTRENSFRCQVCGKVFATEMIQKIHSLSHAGVKPYRCNVCGRGFTQRSPMMYHWRTQHPEETELPPKVPLKSILKFIEDKKKKEARPLFF